MVLIAATALDGLWRSGERRRPKHAAGENGDGEEDIDKAPERGPGPQVGQWVVDVPVPHEGDEPAFTVSKIISPARQRQLPVNPELDGRSSTTW